MKWKIKHLKSECLCFQLEDDVIAKSGYYDEIKAFTAQEASKDWLFLEFSQLGFIGVYSPSIESIFVMFD